MQHNRTLRLAVPSHIGTARCNLVTWMVGGVAPVIQATAEREDDVQMSVRGGEK